MIKLRSKAKAGKPEMLAIAGEREEQSLEAAYNAGVRSFSFDSGIYGHTTVKKHLLDLQAGKCCFCEAKIDHVDYGDVEHFRPKAGWVQEDEPIQKPGYYWLAYDWENLFLSCRLCNERYKKNYFPLINPDSRAHCHHDDIALESPEFINPVNDEPEEHITFVEEIPKPRNNSFRGKKTIERLGLERIKLNEHRRTKFELVKDLYDLAKDCPPTPESIKANARAVVTKYRHQSEDDSTEYASMLRCFFRAHPIDF